MFEFVTYAAWFGLGLFLGIVGAYAWFEHATAISYEEAAKLGFPDEGDNEWRH